MKISTINYYYIVSNVKELPEKGAKVICQLKQNVEAIILEIPFIITSLPDEDGNVREGYIANKNMKLLDEEISDAQDT